MTAERETCRRLLVGLGDDTYDPECGKPRGHSGICEPAEDEPPHERECVCDECEAWWLVRADGCVSEQRHDRDDAHEDVEPGAAS
jgi:hypothetical protein